MEDSVSAGLLKAEISKLKVANRDTFYIILL